MNETRVLAHAWLKASLSEGQNPRDVTPNLAFHVYFVVAAVLVRLPGEAFVLLGLDKAFPGTERD